MFYPCLSSSPSSEYHGFWGVPTASIDWCEKNYEYSHYIAEFYNSLSSLLIMLVGVFGMRTAIKNKLEPRMWLMFGVAGLVGLGSTAFHTSLLYSSQLLDEIPMMISLSYNALIGIFMYNKNPMPVWAIVLEVLYLIGYTIFHVHYRLVSVFHYNFAALCIISNGAILRVCIKEYKHHHLRIGLRLMFGYSFFSLFGLAHWLVDHHFCEEVPVNLELHAWWHIYVAIAQMWSLSSLRFFRCFVLHGFPPKVEFKFWIFPITYDHPDELKAQKAYLDSNAQKKSE